MSTLRLTPKTSRTTPKREMKILIVYYSLYGHVFRLAQAVKEGAESVKGAEVLFRRLFNLADRHLTDTRLRKRALFG